VTTGVPVLHALQIPWEAEQLETTRELTPWSVSFMGFEEILCHWSEARVHLPVTLFLNPRLCPASTLFLPTLSLFGCYFYFYVHLFYAEFIPMS
jgi:hypothetical protein